MKTNKGLVEYCEMVLKEPTIYMLSGFGRKLTEAAIQRRIATGCKHTRDNIKRIRQGIGDRVFDCVGLIKGYLWEITPDNIQYNVPEGSDQNVRMMFNAAYDKGSIENLPDIPGLLVFNKSLSHVGVYVGMEGGKPTFIESTPAFGAWGVVKTQDPSRWFSYGKYPLIKYLEEEIKPAEPVDKTIKIGDTVIVNGIGTSSPKGTGLKTKRFLEHRMKVIDIVKKEGNINAYALNQYNKGTPNINGSNPRRAGTTAWFSEKDIRKE